MRSEILLNGFQYTNILDIIATILHPKQMKLLVFLCMEFIHNSLSLEQKDMTEKIFLFLCNQIKTKS